MANIVAQTYALSLFEIAKERNKEELLLSQLEEICALAEEYPQFLRLLCSPMLSREERIKRIDEAFEGQVDLYLLNFLKILVKSGRVSYLSGIEKEYRRLYCLRENIQEVVVLTVVPMSKEMQCKLVSKLENYTGKKILLKNRIDKSLIGGVVLKIGSRQIEDSVKSRLEAVRRRILGDLE